MVGGANGRQGAMWREYHDPKVHDRHQAGLSLAVGILLARGASAPSPVGVVRTGPLTVDLAKHRVLVRGIERALSPVEWDILAHLARRLDYVCSVESITADVWPDDLRRRIDIDGATTLASASHLLRVHVARLRPKLGPARHLVETVTAQGYRLREVPPEAGIV